MIHFTRELFVNKTFRGSLDYEEVNGKTFLTIRISSKKRITDDVISMVGNFFKTLFNTDKE